jgi:hypothetical protein
MRKKKFLKQAFILFCTYITTHTMQQDLQSLREQGYEPEEYELDRYAMQRQLSNTIYVIVNSRDESEETTINQIKEILDTGYDLNFNLGGGFTALHYAVLRGKAQVCEFLITNGANPHIENYDDHTPLSLADGRDRNSLGDEKIMKILKLSKCSIFRPGLNRRENARDAWERYNSVYNLNLELGTDFLNQ